MARISYSVEYSTGAEIEAVLAVGCEVEFYVVKDGSVVLHHNILGTPLHKEIEYLYTTSLENETADGQYEAVFKHTFDTGLLTNNIINFTDTLHQNLNPYDFEPIFGPKPIAHSTGSGMHFHISLHDRLDYSNIMLKNHRGALILDRIIYGIFDHFKSNWRNICSEKCLERFNDKSLNIPAGLCWGTNNRTVGIRVININQPQSCRAEFRIPSSGTCPKNTIEFLKQGIEIGLNKHHTSIATSPYARVYGNAHDSQYNITRLADVISL